MSTENKSNKEIADELIEKYNDERMYYQIAFRTDEGIKVYDEDDYYLGTFTDLKFITWMGVSLQN
mgnify:CR=1 FL=1